MLNASYASDIITEQENFYVFRFFNEQTNAHVAAIMSDTNRSERFAWPQRRCLFNFDSQVQS